MPFDGYFLHCVSKEIEEAENSHIYKIYQPSREELVLALRKKGFNKKLLISVKGGMARIHFTENAPENPETPPMFCMLLRKYFSAARFTGTKTYGFERVLCLDFEATNEMGDKENLKIICEFLGQSSNIILARESGKIIDAICRTGIENTSRIIAPGAFYELPESREKLDIVSLGAERIAKSAISRGGRLSDALLSVADGMSPLVAREMVYLSGLDDENYTESENLSPLVTVLEDLKNAVISGGRPYILYDDSGTPKDYSFLPISQYGSFYTKKEMESYSALLDTFYRDRELAALQKRAGGDLERLIKNLTSRVNRRINTRKAELGSACDREKWLLYGELIKANIHLITPGSRKVSVLNYYSESGENIDIPLDPALSPAANAAKYFKEYRKSRNAEQTLKALIENDQNEIEYLNTVMFSLSKAKTLSEINEIREELTLAGYIKTNRKTGFKKKKKAPEIESLESKEGYKILVGKNNIQNDYITTVISSKGDLWFHTKNIPGSHVVVLCGGKEVSEETIEYAATLAAAHSAAAASSNVPVDYTPIKYVKKPSGAKAGMVIYTTNKTIYVTPGEKI